MINHLKFITLVLALLYNLSAMAGGVYQQPADFINEVFNNKPPKAEVLWLDKALKKQITDILSHKYKSLRIRYWQRDKKSVWILEEIGKEKPITTGIVVNDSRIEKVKVLEFRESRGWEIRHEFFTDQFKQAKLKDNYQLDTAINNITGATLSVRAIKKLAKIALLLDRHIKHITEK